MLYLTHSACARMHSSVDEFKPGSIRELTCKVDALALAVSEIALTLKELKDALERNISDPRVIIVEEMDKNTAKQKVLDFMKSHKTSDIAQLHENIKCDIMMLIEIIDELCREGKISEGE